MSVTKKSIGTGITTRDETHIDLRNGVGPEEQEAMKALLEGAATDHLNETRAFCERLAGDRKAKRLEAMQRMEAAETQDERDEARAERDALPNPDVDSEQWYAEKVLTILNLADSERDQGRLHNASRYDFQAGVIFGEAGMKFAWEDHALRGQKVLQAARDGHALIHGTSAEKLARWAVYQLVMDEVRKRNPDASKNKILEIVMAETHASRSTLKRRTEDPGPRKK